MMKQIRKITAFMLAAGLCCTALLCTACGESSGSSKENNGEANSGRSIYVPEVPETPVSEDAPGEDFSLAIGETLQYNDKLEITFDRAVELDDVNKMEYRVLLAEITITNKSDVKLDCSTLTHFYLIVDGEEDVEATRDAQASVAARKYYTKTGSSLLSFNQEIAAGESLSGYAYIYAPTAWEEMQLVYMPYRYYNNDRVLFNIDESKLTHYAESLS